MQANRLQLRVGQMVEDTEAEGPGRRFAIWTQGCSIRCPQCCNPHLFAERGGSLWNVDELVSKIRHVPNIEGISVLGGEPFDQPDALNALCEQTRSAGLSVLVFSGYRIEELNERGAKLDGIDILVDGRYVAEMPETRRRWVGSSNQRIHGLTPEGQRAVSRFEAHGNTIEIRLRRSELTVNGWPTTQKVVSR